MADQLLSQSDVDSLIASLTQNGEISAAVSKTIAPNKSPSTGETKKQGNGKPVEVKDHVTDPDMLVENVKVTPAPNQAKVPISNTSKSDNNVQMLNKLNDKIDDLARKIWQYDTISKKVDLIEKRLIALENTVGGNRSKVDIETRVNSLVEEIKKINIGLKGTPGYAIKHKFTCNNCDDHGHIAIKYRCTKCGHEKWYGWWPDK